MSDAFEEEFHEYERPNKSKLKREAQALVELTKQMVEISESVWPEFGLSDEILSELRFLKNIEQFGAKKRQLKRVAKLLRDVDVSAIERIVEASKQSGLESNAAFHLIEHWRDRLIQDENDPLSEFLAQYPNAEVQRLRQLIRNAKKEMAVSQSPKSSRLLFKLLREIIT